MKKLVLLVVFVFFLSFGKVILAETCSPTWVSLDKIYTGAIFLNIGKDNKPMVLYTEYIKTGSVNGSRFLKCTSNDCKSFNDINFDGLFQWWSGGAGNFSDGSVAFVMVTNNMDMYFVKCSDDKCSNYTKILFKKDIVMDRDNTNYEIKANSPSQVVVDGNDLPFFYFTQSFVYGSGTQGDPYVDLYLVRCSKKDCSEYKVNKLDTRLYGSIGPLILDKNNNVIMFNKIHEYVNGSLKKQVVLDLESDGIRTIIDEASNSCTNSNELNSLSMYLGDDGNPVLNYIKRVGSGDGCTNKYITVFCKNKTCTEKNVIDTVKGINMKKGREGYPVYEYVDKYNSGVIVCKNADCSEKIQRSVLTDCNPDFNLCPRFVDFELDNEFKPVFLINRWVSGLGHYVLDIYRCCTVDCGTTFEPLNWYGTCKNVVDEARGCTKCESDSYQGMNRWGGDYNCSGDLTTGDYIVWRDEFLKKGTERNADGDCDGKTSLSDYSKWREEYLK